MSSTPSPNSTESHTSSLPHNLVLPNSRVGSALTRGQSIRDHIITRTDSSHSRYRMSVSLQLVVGVQTHLIPFYLKFWGLGLELAQVLCGLSQFLWVLIYYFRLCFEYSVALILSATSASYNILTLSALKIPGPYREGRDTHIQFKAQHSLFFAHLMRFVGRRDIVC